MPEIARIGTTSNDTGCPTLFVTERGTLVVQGTTVTDPKALGEIRKHGNGIPTHESCVEIPPELLPFVDIEALKQVAFSNTDRPEFVVDPVAVSEIPAGRP